MHVLSRDSPHPHLGLSLRAEARVPKSLALTQYDIVERSFGGNVSGHRTQM